MSEARVDVPEEELTGWRFFRFFVLCATGVLTISFLLAYCKEA